MQYSNYTFILQVLSKKGNNSQYSASNTKQKQIGKGRMINLKIPIIPNAFEVSLTLELLTNKSKRVYLHLEGGKENEGESYQNKVYKFEKGTTEECDVKFLLLRRKRKTESRQKVYNIFPTYRITISYTSPTQSLILHQFETSVVNSANFESSARGREMSMENSESVLITINEPLASSSFGCAQLWDNNDTPVEEFFCSLNPPSQRAEIDDVFLLYG